MDDAKMAFVQEVLGRKGEQMRQAIIKSITKEGLSQPAEGITGRVVGDGYEMTIPLLRRFQDMGAPLERRVGLASENVLTHNLPMLKGKKFAVYNRNVWGFFNSIARELMYGYTAEVAQRIKQQLEL